jgi:hypothetical protein
VQPGRVDALAVGQHDRVGERVEGERLAWPLAVQVALLGDPVDGVKGSMDRAHGATSFRVER